MYKWFKLKIFYHSMLCIFYSFCSPNTSIAYESSHTRTIISPPSSVLYTFVPASFNLCKVSLCGCPYELSTPQDISAVSGLTNLKNSLNLHLCCHDAQLLIHLCQTASANPPHCLTFWHPVSDISLLYSLHLLS